MKQTIRVVMLSTERADGLFILVDKITGSMGLGNPTSPSCHGSQAQHLYLISDEQIQENDWCYNEDLPTSKIYQFGKGTPAKGSSKIIASTDWQQLSGSMQLHKYMPKVPESFLQAFTLASGEIDEVQVAMMQYGAPENPLFELDLKDDNTVRILPAKTYTRQDLRKAMDWAYLNAKSIGEFDQWIKDNL